MNLSKILKQKRDAEKRHESNRTTVVFAETPSGEQSYFDTSNFATKNEVAGWLANKSDITHNHDLEYVKISDVQKYIKTYEPLTNGDLLNTELLFAEGDILKVEVV